MRLIPSDPDIGTIIGRIQDGSLNLQPEFQRGEVWGRQKQRLLIDSILRNWYVPPVHVVRTETDEQEVLDGQQRLLAISEFVMGKFTIDGKAEPITPEIQALGGLRYNDLEAQARRRFDRFTLRMFELVDYEPEEPYELFFRLNQPTTLTSAEKRNAFFGIPRQQIKDLTLSAQNAGMTPHRVGFSNARLAYEDVIARFVWTLEAGTLGEKVISARITNRYRSSDPFPPSILDWAQDSIAALFSQQCLGRDDVRLNKATTHSWLCFAARGLRAGQSLDQFDAHILRIESARNTANSVAVAGKQRQNEEILVRIFNDRATSRVNDVSSVILRDVILWVTFAIEHDCQLPNLHILVSTVERISQRSLAGRILLDAATEVGWEWLG